MGIPDKVERPSRGFCFIVLSRKKYLYGNLNRIRKRIKKRKELPQTYKSIGVVQSGYLYGCFYFEPQA